MNKLFIATLCFLITFCFAQQDGPNWMTIRRVLTVRPNKGFGAVDYSTAARQIRGQVTCSRTCDIYLVTGAEFDNLISGRAFKWEQGSPSVSSYRFTLVTDRNLISRRLFAVVVNTGVTFSLDATFVLEQDVEPGSILGALVALVLLAPCICCCCALFVVCGIIGAMRNMILDMLGFRRGGYTQFGGGYNAGYSGSSSGGNTYSGTIGGGSSGGYSSGYGSSSGGNSYSGSI